MVQLIPNQTLIPVYTDINVVKQAISDIVHILKKTEKNNIPTVLKGDAIKNAFKQVAELLNNNKTPSLPEINRAIPTIVSPAKQSVI